MSINCETARVCSDHFITGKPSPLYAGTNPDWVPTLKLCYSAETSSSVSSTGRYQRAQKRQSKRQRRELQEEVEEDVEVECDSYVSDDDDDDDSPVCT